MNKMGAGGPANGGASFEDEWMKVNPPQKLAGGYMSRSDKLRNAARRAADLAKKRNQARDLKGKPSGRAILRLPGKGRGSR